LEALIQELFGESQFLSLPYGERHAAHYLIQKALLMVSRMLRHSDDRGIANYAVYGFDKVHFPVCFVALLNAAKQSKQKSKQNEV
jgi:hypothetical protein